MYAARTSCSSSSSEAGDSALRSAAWRAASRNGPAPSPARLLVGRQPLDHGGGGRVALGRGVDRRLEVGGVGARQADLGEAPQQRGRRLGRTAARVARGDDAPVLRRGDLARAVGQRERQAAEERRQVAERLVELRAVDLVDDQPLLLAGGGEDVALREARPRPRARRCRGRVHFGLAVESAAPSERPACTAALATATARVVLPEPAGPAITRCLPDASAATMPA